VPITCVRLSFMAWPVDTLSLRGTANEDDLQAWDRTYEQVFAAVIDHVESKPPPLKIGRVGHPERCIFGRGIFTAQEKKAKRGARYCVGPSGRML